MGYTKQQLLKYLHLYLIPSFKGNLDMTKELPGIHQKSTFIYTFRAQDLGEPERVAFGHVPLIEGSVLLSLPYPSRMQNSWSSYEP